MIRYSVKMLKEVFVKKRKVLITMDDDLYKRVEILAEKCHRSRPDQFRHLLLTHPDMEKTPVEKE